jgi:hypothetical protein
VAVLFAQVGDAGAARFEALAWLYATVHTPS